MKKFIINFVTLIFIFLIILILILSSIGIKTNKFSKLISNKIAQSKNIDLTLSSIKFKLDPAELSLFLETQNPIINYKDIFIPTESIKVYIDFLSLLKSKQKIEKVNIVLKELDIVQLNKLSTILKPSNFKSLINNKIKQGKLISEIEIFFNKQGDFINFIAKGSVKSLEAEILSGVNFSKVNLSFFADKNDILIKNIYGDLQDIEISDGDLSINLENGIKLNSNFSSKLNLNKKSLSKFSQVVDENYLIKNIKNLNADLNNNLSINLDSTYKLVNYDYKISGNLKKGGFILSKPLKNIYLSEDIREIYFSEMQIKSSFNSKKINFNGSGKYSLDNQDFFKIKFNNNLENNVFNTNLNFDYKRSIDINIINYKKLPNKIANLSLDLEKKKNGIKVKKFSFKEGNNLIKIIGVELKENQFVSFKEIEVKTAENDFSIKNDKKIVIKGSKFDASNLAKIFNKKNTKNKFENFNRELEIDLKSIQVPVSEKLKNFKLLGQIKKGKFVKISSKGDFGGNNFLDISMKKDRSTNKKYLEIYSDLTRPLLTEYSFFKGLSGGKLLFTSIIDNSKSNSKLKIENFKVINAPDLVKLLSLADLRGLADLAEGEGLSFDVLEIDMEKNKNFLKINEILALGPSMSVLMEGYQEESGLISLRGTLVPAKTLNKMISKIPVIGKIVIPKEVGEGLFGVSFKIKGQKDQIKTTINPIRTLTPRFIQKIIERNKKIK